MHSVDIKKNSHHFDQTLFTNGIAHCFDDDHVTYLKTKKRFKRLWFILIIFLFLPGPFHCKWKSCQILLAFWLWVLIDFYYSFSLSLSLDHSLACLSIRLSISSFLSSFCVLKRGRERNRETDCVCVSEWEKYEVFIKFVLPIRPHSWFFIRVPVISSQKKLFFSKKLSKFLFLTAGGLSVKQFNGFSPGHCV